MENEKKLQEVLKESRERRTQFLKEQMEFKKKQKRKEIILTTIIIIIIVILTGLCLNNINNNNIKKCINAGNSKEICEVKL